MSSDNLVSKEMHNVREVLVIHGHDEGARSALFAFLRALRLDPLEKTALIGTTGQASPFIKDLLDVAFHRVQAVVVLLTPDDKAFLRKELQPENDASEETKLAGQARQDVIISIGMSLALQPSRTVLVQLGQVRIPSYLLGRDIIKIDTGFEWRQELAVRLESIGCAVNREGKDWLSEGDFPIEYYSSLESEGLDESLGNPAFEDCLIVNRAYFRILHFSILIHHEFHELHHQGTHELGLAARELYKTSLSEDKNLSLIYQCSNNWAKSIDARSNVQKLIIESIDQYAELVDSAFSYLLENTDGISRYKIIGCLGYFDVVNKSLKDYEIQIQEVSDCFRQNTDNLDEEKINEFTQWAMAIDITIDRLISKADVMIKDTFEALENDCCFVRDLRKSNV